MELHDGPVQHLTALATYFAADDIAHLSRAAGLEPGGVLRWLSQTLGQLAGKVWRLSHPLLGAYRLAVPGTLFSIVCVNFSAKLK